VRTAHDAVRYFSAASSAAADAKTVPFFYCVAAPPASAAAAARPYDLVVVPRSVAARAREYWTVSATGVVRLEQASSSSSSSASAVTVEAWPLCDWMRESALFDALSAIPLFRDSALRRRFARWRAAARRSAYERNRSRVAERLLASNPAFASCLSAVQAAITELDAVPFAWPAPTAGEGGGGSSRSPNQAAAAALRSAAAALAAAASSSSSSPTTLPIPPPVASASGAALVTLSDFATLQRATRDGLARPAVATAHERARAALAACAARAHDANAAASRAVERDEKGEEDDAEDEDEDHRTLLSTAPALIGREARRRRALCRPMSVARAEAQARREALGRARSNVSLLPSLARLADALFCSRVAAQGAASAAAVVGALEGGVGSAAPGAAASAAASPVAFAVKYAFAATPQDDAHAASATATFEPDERAVTSCVGSEALDGIAALVEQCPRLLEAVVMVETAAAATATAPPPAPASLIPPPLQLLRDTASFAGARARIDGAVSRAYRAASGAASRELERHMCVWSYLCERERERLLALEAERERVRCRLAAAEEAARLLAVKKAAAAAAKEARAARRAAARAAAGGGEQEADEDDDDLDARSGSGGSGGGGASSLNVAGAGGSAYFDEDEDEDEDDGDEEAAGEAAAAARADETLTDAPLPAARTDKEEAAAAAAVLAESRLKLAQLRAWSAALSRARTALPAACLQVDAADLRSALARGVAEQAERARGSLLRAARAATLSALREASWRADAAEDLPVGVPGDDDDDEEEDEKEEDEGYDGGLAAAKGADGATKFAAAPQQPLRSGSSMIGVGQHLGGADAVLEEGDDEAEQDEQDEEAQEQSAAAQELQQQQAAADDADGLSPLDRYVAYAALHAEQQRARPSIAAALTVIDELFELLSMTAASSSSSSTLAGDGSSAAAAAAAASAATTPAVATLADQVRRDDAKEQLARLDAALAAGSAWLAARRPRQQAALRAARADLAEEAQRVAAALRGELREEDEEDEEEEEQQEEADGLPPPPVPALALPPRLALQPEAAAPPPPPPLPAYLDPRADPEEALDDAETLVAASEELAEMAKAQSEHRRLLREAAAAAAAAAGGGDRGGESDDGNGSNAGDCGSSSGSDDGNGENANASTITPSFSLTSTIARCRSQAEALANAWRALRDFGAQRRAWTEELALDGDGCPLLDPAAVSKSLEDVLERAGGLLDGVVVATKGEGEQPAADTPSPPVVIGEGAVAAAVAAVAARLRDEARAFERGVLPVVRPLSNPDLKPRHWLAVSTLLASATAAAGGPDELALAAYPPPTLVTPRAAFPPPVVSSPRWGDGGGGAGDGADAATAAARALGSPRPPLAAVLLMTTSAGSPSSPRRGSTPAAPTPAFPLHVLPLDPSAASGLAPFSLAHLMPHRPLDHLPALWRVSRAATAEARATRALAASRSAAAAQLRVRAERMMGAQEKEEEEDGSVVVAAATARVQLVLAFDDERNAAQASRPRYYSVCFGGGEQQQLRGRGVGGGGDDGFGMEEEEDDDDEDDEEQEGDSCGVLAAHERRAERLEAKLRRRAAGEATSAPVLQAVVQWRAEVRAARELASQLQRVQNAWSELRVRFEEEDGGGGGGGGGNSASKDAFLLADTAWQALLYGLGCGGGSAHKVSTLPPPSSTGLLQLARDEDRRAELLAIERWLRMAAAAAGGSP
jgi:hypothetical protein